MPFDKQGNRGTEHVSNLSKAQLAGREAWLQSVYSEPECNGYPCCNSELSFFFDDLTQNCPYFFDDMLIALIIISPVNIN